MTAEDNAPRHLRRSPGSQTRAGDEKRGMTPGSPARPARRVPNRRSARASPLGGRGRRAPCCSQVQVAGETDKMPAPRSPACQLARDGRQAVALLQTSARAHASMESGNSRRRRWYAISTMPLPSNSSRKAGSSTRSAWHEPWASSAASSHPAAWFCPLLIPPVDQLPKLDAVGVGGGRPFHGGRVFVVGHDVQVVHPGPTTVVMLLDPQTQRRRNRGRDHLLFTAQISEDGHSPQLRQVVPLPDPQRGR